MEMTTTRAAAYVGGSAAAGAAFGALGGGGKGAALGLATGVAAGAVQSLVHHQTGVSELGLLAAVGGGAATGALLLAGMAPAGLSPIAARGVGAAVGGVTGLVGSVVAGMVLSAID